MTYPWMIAQIIPAPNEAALTDSSRGQIKATAGSRLKAKAVKGRVNKAKMIRLRSSGNKRKLKKTAGRHIAKAGYRNRICSLRVLGV